MHALRCWDILVCLLDWTSPSRTGPTALLLQAVRGMRTRRTTAHETVIHVQVPGNRTIRPLKRLSNGLSLYCCICSKRADIGTPLIFIVNKVLVRWMLSFQTPGL